MEYNAILTVPTVEDIDSLMEALSDYRVALGFPRRGEAEVVLTYPATDVRQAAATALAVAKDHGLDVQAISVETVARYDKLTSEVTIPALISVTEAAEILNVTRQAVLHRIKSGALQATRVGDAWVIPKAVI